MKAQSRPFTRLIAAAGVAGLLLIVTAAILLLPDSAPTRAQGPDQATPLPPMLPPPIQVNPPLATPAPLSGQGTSGMDTAGLEAVRFRPQVRIAKGERALSSQDVAKPPESDRSGAAKPPTDRTPGPKEPYTPPDDGSLLGAQDWVPALYEGFEGIFPGAWYLWDLSDDGYDRTWGDTSYYSQEGWWSAWPAAGGADALNPYTDWYADNLNSWMEYGPLDFTNMIDVFVSFGLWYDTEQDWDMVYFCAAIAPSPYDCVEWSGYSEGWTDQAFWLTSYAGYSQVWLAWVFQSNESISWGYEGPFVDEIQVWGYEVGAAPTPTPTPDPLGMLIDNGSFEDPLDDHLIYWNVWSTSSLGATEEGTAPSFPSRFVGTAGGEVGVQSIGVLSDTYVDGEWSAYLWQEDGEGFDWLYQTFDVPADVDDVELNYWFAVTTWETEGEQDLFCASLRPASDLNAILVDMGCLDAVDTSGDWQEASYSLTGDEVAAVEGQTLALVFEMYNTGAYEDHSTAWVDYVRVYATGPGAGAPLDPNEANDDPASATPLTCNATITSTSIGGIIGDALGGSDVDWFVLADLPPGQLNVDIAADTLVPSSDLDSVVGLWDSSITLVDWNDDDGISYDSYLTYTVPSVYTYYVSVESYWGTGSPNSFYTLTVQCGGAVTGTGPGSPGEIPPTVDTWTVMLYLNAEDAGFESILTGYRQDIEDFIGSKSSFLTVVILYDASGSGDTVRYLVQPNGNYTAGTNQWNLGELNMGHPSTLDYFVTWAMDQYPADHYYLAVDDHGDGVYGISYDGNSNNDQLTAPELYTALKSATHNGQRKIDIFDYEACLMGLAENAYDLHQWVDYVVFSEQISWGINTYPRYFGDLVATDTPLDVGQRIVERYHQEALTANNGRGFPHTISLIDTSKMEGVKSAASAFGDALHATGDPAPVNGARDASQAFAADYDATNSLRAEYIDLWDLADNLGSLVPAQAAAVKSAVQAAVIRERYASGGVAGYAWDHSGAHGLAIYYPTSSSSSAYAVYVDAANPLYQMSRGANGTWDDFLQWVLSDSAPRRGMFASRAYPKGGSEEDAYAYKHVYVPLILRNR